MFAQDLIRKKSKLFVQISILLIVALSLAACDNGTPTPAPTVYTPGCSVPNLIGHINQANNNSPAVINLDYCVYTLTEAENSAQVDGITVYNGLPVITGDITIQGNNAVIEIVKDPGEPNFGHFFVDPDADLAIYDLLISDGSRPVGGAVVNNGGDFFASDVTFIDNTTFPADNGIPARGGAIFSIDGRVRVIDDCHFQDNSAGETVAAGANLGGAIYAKDSGLTVSSSSFLWNFAAGDGGAIYTEKTPANDGGGLITISDSQFNENTAERNGGALAVINEVEGVILGTTWFRQGEAGNFGGGIYAEGTEISGSHLDFKLNNAAYGGGVFTRLVGEGSPSSFAIAETTYIGNLASEIGGAIFSENSDLDLDGSFFEANRASSCGGVRNGGYPTLDVRAGDLETASRVLSNSRISDSQFNFNYAEVLDGGGVCHVMGELAVRDTIFSGNNAIESGGGILVQDEAEITGSSFIINQASNGGGVFIGHPIDLNPGGGLEYAYVDYLDFFTLISGARFSTNHAERAGGGLYAHSSGTTRIEGSYFHGNTTMGSGGGLFRYAGRMFINNSTFSANSARRGGAVRAAPQVGSQMGIKHATFAFNTATETSSGGNVYNTMWGGGALNLGHNATVENSLIYQNSPMDCQLENGSNYSASASYDSDGTCAMLTEANPEIEPLQDNGGGTMTHALHPSSPLIDILPDCAGMTIDQRGINRPQGANCDPGAYELDPQAPPPPPPPMEIGTPQDSGSEEPVDRCGLFDEQEISLVMLAIPSDTMVFPLYFKILGGIPGLALEVPETTEEWDYRAQLGSFESYRCGLQGFDDRLYCLFYLTPEAPGQVMELKLWLNECPDPIFTLPSVIVPEPELVCQPDLNESACQAAGGTFVIVNDEGVTTCNCP